MIRHPADAVTSVQKTFTGIPCSTRQLLAWEHDVLVGCPHKAIIPARETSRQSNALLRTNEQTKKDREAGALR